MIRKAALEDVPAVKAIANAYRDELGYVMWPALREAVVKGELYVAVLGDRVVGFANTHTRRDGWTTVYEIAVLRHSTRQGIGHALLDALPRPVRLKCTVDNIGANAFYAHYGMKLIGQESGRKRQLNVWQAE